MVKSRECGERFCGVSNRTKKQTEVTEIIKKVRNFLRKPLDKLIRTWYNGATHQRKEVIQMKKFSFISCPFCDRILIDLNPNELDEHEYFCDECCITIEITEEEKNS